MEMTKHLVKERLERTAYILSKVGLGEHLKECDKTTNDTIRILTTTGLIIIYNKEKTKIVTLYIATLAQAKQFYGESKLPNALYYKVKSNQKFVEKTWNYYK